MYEIFCTGNKGLDLKGVRYNWNCMVGTPVNDKKIRGVHGTPTEGELECVGGGWWGNGKICL